MQSDPRPVAEKPARSRPVARQPGAKTSRRSEAAKCVTPAPVPPGTLEVILVGCSATAEAQCFPILHTLQRAGVLRVTAIVDPDEHAREILLRAFPETVPANSYESVAVAPGALVVVSSPPRFHPLHVSGAVKRGWHVWCETPLAGTARDASAMIAAAQRHERLLAVDLHKRFFPAARFIRSLCRDHLLGPLFQFRISEGAPPASAPSPRMPARFEAPDGVLIELGLPALDFLVWCLGPATLLSYADDAMGGVEANAFIDLTFPEGVRGTVHLSRDWPTTQSYAFLFERGIVRWSVEHANRLVVQLANTTAALDAVLLDSLSPREPNAMPPPQPSLAESQVAQWQNVVRAIAGQEPLRVPATEAMHSLPLIEECYARRTLLEPPWFTRNEIAHARALSAPTAFRRP